MRSLGGEFEGEGFETEMVLVRWVGWRGDEGSIRGIGAWGRHFGRDAREDREVLVLVDHQSVRCGYLGEV